MSQAQNVYFPASNGPARKRVRRWPCALTVAGGSCWFAVCAFMTKGIAESALQSASMLALLEIWQPNICHPGAAGTIASLLKCINRRGSGRTDHSMRLSVRKSTAERGPAPGASPGTEHLRRILAPNHLQSTPIGHRDRRMRSIQGGTGINRATKRTCPIIAACPPAWSAGLPARAALSWQMRAAWRGSEAAMLVAQHAAIGASFCTTRAVRTIGRNFRNRRRIRSKPPFRPRHLIIPEVRSRDRVPRDACDLIEINFRTERCRKRLRFRCVLLLYRRADYKGRMYR